MAIPADNDSLPFEERVAQTLKEASKDDKGKLKFAEGTPDEIVYSARAEQRRRDTQSEYTKARQLTASLEAEKKELIAQLSNNVNVTLDPNKVAELEELKYSEPDKWRQQINFYENEARDKHSQEVGERLKEISTKSGVEAEIERRTLVLEEYNYLNPGFVLDDKTIENDIPPRISNKLINNEITFDQFLLEARDYLGTNKTMVTADPTLQQPNLGDVGGGGTPSDNIGSKAVRYEDAIY